MTLLLYALTVVIWGSTWYAMLFQIGQVAPAASLTATVIVPVHNGAAHLKRCLVALAASTEDPREVIVCDDASSDESAEIARSAGAAGQRILRRHAAGGSSVSDALRQATDRRTVHAGPGDPAVGSSGSVASPGGTLLAVRPHTRFNGSAVRGTEPAKTAAQHRGWFSVPSSSSGPSAKVTRATFAEGRGRVRQ